MCGGIYIGFTSWWECEAIDAEAGETKKRLMVDAEKVVNDDGVDDDGTEALLSMYGKKRLAVSFRTTRWVLAGIGGVILGMYVLVRELE